MSGQYIDIQSATMSASWFSRGNTTTFDADLLRTFGITSTVNIAVHRFMQPDFIIFSSYSIILLLSEATHADNSTQTA